MCPQGMAGNQGDLDTKHQHKISMISSNGRTCVNRQLMSKEHRNVLAGSKLQFWIKLVNVKESFMQCEEYNVRTGTKISSTNFAKSCWEEQIIDKIILNWMFSLCVLGKPYICGRCKPVGRTLS